MKNFIKIICITLVLGTVGCTKYLDIKPKGKDIAENIKHFDGMFNSVTLINLTYMGVYEGALALLQSNVFFPHMGDEITITKESVAQLSLPDKRAYNWEKVIFTEDMHCAEWSSFYAQNYTLNVIINNVMNAQDGSVEQKQALLAEASVRRAFNFLMLAQFFAKPYNKSTASTDLAIPLVKEANTTIKHYDRATVEEVYSFVISEMEKHCPYLPEKTVNNVRLSKSAGYTFLGRAYLYLGDYPNALKALNVAYDAMKASSDVVGFFDYNVKMAEWGYNAEIPWAFARGNIPYPNRSAYIESMYTLQGSLAGSLYYYEPSTFIKDEFMAKYSSYDLRRNFFAKKNYTGTVDWPMYRKINHTGFNVAASLPDLYLMLAECEARIGDTDKARFYLYELRKNRMAENHASVPASVISKDDLTKFVIEERTREFMQTGYRFFDMRRLWNDPLFQHFKAGYTHIDENGTTITLTEDRLVYSIPEKVMNYNTTWTNNN